MGRRNKTSRTQRPHDAARPLSFEEENRGLPLTQAEFDTAIRVQLGVGQLSEIGRDSQMIPVELRSPR